MRLQYNCVLECDMQANLLERTAFILYHEEGDSRFLRNVVTILSGYTVTCQVNTKGGRTRTDKIGVGAGADIGGTGISCNFMARQYTGPTRQSYRDDHRHVGAMPATSLINRPAFSHFGPCSPFSTQTPSTYSPKSTGILPSLLTVSWLHTPETFRLHPIQPPLPLQSKHSLI